MCLLQLHATLRALRAQEYRQPQRFGCTTHKRERTNEPRLKHVLAQAPPRQGRVERRPLRTGQWTQAEIAFANQVIAHFHAGVLPNCDNGDAPRVTCRVVALLADENIEKVRGDGAIGKRTSPLRALADAARAG